MRPRLLWSFVVPATAAAAIAGIVAGQWWMRRETQAAAPPQIHGYVLPQPHGLTPFALVDSKGQPFEPQAFTGHWSFVFFGYTYCPDVCPVTLVALAAAKKKIEQRFPDVPVEYYFVSVDPARDTPQRLHEYVGYFDPSFHGLTGKDAEIAKFAKQVGAVYFTPTGQGERNYLVSHSSNVVLLDPAGNVHAVFSAPHEPANLAADFATILARTESGRAG